MSKVVCTNAMLDKRSVKSVIKDLALNKEAYVIVSGKADCSDKMLSERLIGMRSVVSNLPEALRKPPVTMRGIFTIARTFSENSRK